MYSLSVSVHLIRYLRHQRISRPLTTTTKITPRTKPLSIARLLQTIAITITPIKWRLSVSPNPPTTASLSPKTQASTQSCKADFKIELKNRKQSSLTKTIEKTWPTICNHAFTMPIQIPSFTHKRSPRLPLLNTRLCTPNSALKSKRLNLQMSQLAKGQTHRSRHKKLVAPFGERELCAI